MYAVNNGPTCNIGVWFICMYSWSVYYYREILGLIINAGCKGYDVQKENDVFGQ